MDGDLPFFSRCVVKPFSRLRSADWSSTCAMDWTQPHDRGGGVNVRLVEADSNSQRALQLRAQAV